ncbi:MAG: FlgD immunoglobulin-like domain containing protein [Candidatus Krumholzibacteriia bacterium]
MCRYAICLLLIGFFAALYPSATAQASECVSWAETTDLPDIFPEIQLDNLAVVGSLLVGTKDQEFFVYRLDEQEEPELISSVPMDQYVRWIRVLEDVVYLIPWSGTSHRVDLVDPENPGFVQVSVPAGDLCDVARFDGGYLMLTTADSVFVVDDPTAAEPRIISVIEADEPIRAAAHGSMVFLAMGRGVLPVDLADPADPVVGEPHHLHPPGPMWSDFGCRSLLVHDGVLYGQFGYYSMNYNAAFTMAVDISDPFEPTAMVRHPEWGVDDGLHVVGEFIAALTSHTLRIYETGDLQPVATIRVGDYTASAGAAFGEDLLIAVPYRGLHRVDIRNPFTVEPAVTMPEGYDPAGCGRYGLATRRSYVYDWEGNAYLRDIDWTIYDQTSVTALDSLAAGHFDVYSGEYECGYWLAIADANDRWVAVRAIGQCSGVDYYYSFENLVIHDLQSGTTETVNQRERGQAVLVGDILWTLSWIPYNHGYLETFHLTDNGVVPLGSLEVPYGTYGLAVADAVVVWSRNAVSVLSPADPEVLTPLRELLVDQDIELWGPGFVEDDRLFTTTNEGVAVIDLDPASLDAPVVIGSCALEIGGSRNPMLRQGDRAIVRQNGSWQAVDFSDPTAPVAASPVSDIFASGMYWSGDLLYINTGTSVHLYDIADIAAPQWVGQSTYQESYYTSPCGLDGYVMSAGHALLPDCNDPTPIEPIVEDDPIAIPSAVSLLPVVPNPFNPSTTITFELRRTEQVDLAVYDLRGRRLATVLDRQCPAGEHRVTWYGRDDRGRAMPSGTYLVQLCTELSVRSTKAVLVR